MAIANSTSLQITLPISDERFERIIRHRDGDEPIADLILRLLDTATSITPASEFAVEGSGVKTRYYDFPEGFEIFRTANGTRYSAKAKNGKWVTPAGKQFSSLNELSRFVTNTPENAWVSWNFTDANGKTKRINELRDKRAIATRHRPPTDNDDDKETITWRDDVYAALKGMNGPATLYEIYRLTRRLREKRGVDLPANAEAIIRRTLEENSSDSNSYRGRYNLFKSVNGIGSGVWALR